MSMRRLVWVLVIGGCGGEGDVCFGGPPKCEGDTLVECVPDPNNPSHIKHTGCTFCMQRGDEAACVESRDGCDPASFTPSCTAHTGVTQAVVCASLFSSAPKSYPVAFEPGCVDSDIYVCNSDGSATHTACTGDNYCNSITAGGAPRLVCAFSSSPCDPQTYQQGCSANNRVVICADITGNRDFYPKAVAPGSPGTMVNCP